ncbi:MAG: S1/P1 nuclease [Pseudomonadales bacterium]|nr:S1/P1 nuclease [Pseudomonadales bacterium]MCP5344237.1 S1/P1 nuclease [Pseudomonadales bacterium]
MTFRFLISVCLALLLPLPALAWDATSHRLSAYVAWEALTPAHRNRLLKILEKHPRYEQDFLDQMPVNVMVADSDTQGRWLLGQAAVWPDLARGLETEERIRYNRPDWHWIDGAWMRGDALQGNVYVGVDPLPSIHGEAQGAVEDEQDVHNVVQGIEYNARVLADPIASASARALALCWLLHLVGDVHQPLHTGALVSTSLFPTGDRGGNGIPTRFGSLHATWDGALRNQPFDDTLRRMNSTLRQTTPAMIDMNIDTWLQESRQIMQEFVYTDEIKAAVLRSERRRTALPTFALDEDYLGGMQAISEDRVTQAGTRLYLSLRRILNTP